ELLRDPRFETVRSGSTSSPWQSFGGTPAATNGCSGLEITSAGGVVQTFDAQPNATYSVTMSIASLGSGAAYGKLQINWDGPRQFANIEIAPVDAETTYRMSTTAPADRSTGTIYASGYGAGPV